MLYLLRAYIKSRPSSFARIAEHVCIRANEACAVVLDLHEKDHI